MNEPPPRVPQPIPRSPGFSVLASLRAEPLRYALSADSTEFAWLLLRAGADALDRGGAYRAVTAAGAFDLSIAWRRGSWVGVAAAPGADEALAGYYPSWRPGGTLVVRDYRYRLRKQWGVGWALRDGRGVIARLGQPAESLYAGTVRVKLGRAAQETPDCDLVLTLGVWAVMLERVALSGAGR